jgi:hypothetical protein
MWVVRAESLVELSGVEVPQAGHPPAPIASPPGRKRAGASPKMSMRSLAGVSPKVSMYSLGSEDLVVVWAANPA